MTKQAATLMDDALNLRKQKWPDPDTAPPLYDSATDAESSPMQEPVRNESIVTNK